MLLRQSTPDFPVFVFVPGGDGAQPVHHLGLAYLRAALFENHGVESTQVVGRESATGYLKRIRALEPTIVGFTTYDNNFRATATLSRLVRQALPDVPIVLGGPTATFSPEVCLAMCPWIDACVGGEGEETFPDLLFHYREQGRLAPPSDVPGVHYREDEAIVHSGERPLLGTGDKTSLDVAPSPYLSGILDARTQAGIATSRGCVFKCTYCNFTAMSKFRIRYHSVERVLGDIEAIARSAADPAQVTVDLHDDIFGVNRKRAEPIVQGIIDGDFGLRFTALIRADMISDGFLELLARANFSDVGFGLESTDPHVLRLCKKLGDSAREEPTFRKELEYVESVRRKVELAAKLGIQTDVSVILGLPGDTEQTAQKTLDDVRSMPCTRYVHNLLSVYPGTELWEACQESGITVEQQEKAPPRHTQHAFSARNLKFSERAHVSPLSLALGLQLGRFLANIVTGGEPAIGGNGGIVALQAWQDPSDHADFVLDTVKQPGLLVQLLAEDEDEPEFQSQESELFMSRVVHLRSRVGAVRMRGERRAVQLESTSSTHVANFHPRISIAPYEAFEPSDEPFRGGTGDPYEIRIGTLLAAADMKALLEDLSRQGAAQAGPQTVASKCDFLTDACKLADTPCLGMSPSGLAIDEQGDQRVCHSCPGFPVGTSVERMVQFMRRATEEVRERRGCAGCEISNKCSCCPFPAPLSEEKFCHVSRSLGGRKRFLSMGPLGYAYRFVEGRDRVGVPSRKVP